MASGVSIQPSVRPGTIHQCACLSPLLTRDKAQSCWGIPRGVMRRELPEVSGSILTLSLW